MEEELQESIRKVVNIYSGHFYWRNCKGEQSFDFWDFISILKGKKYKDFSQQLSSASRELGYTESELVLHAMTEKQKTQLGAKFQDSFNDGFLEFRSRNQNKIDEIVLKSHEVQEYRRTIQPYLGDNEVNRRALARLAETIYGRLSEEDRKSIGQKQILVHMLNLGFLRIPRVSHRAACNFIVKYPALFRNEGEVIGNLVERLVDEELATTPIERTMDKINELKLYAEQLYGVTK